MQITVRAKKTFKGKPDHVVSSSLSFTVPIDGVAFSSVVNTADQTIAIEGKFDASAEFSALLLTGNYSPEALDDWPDAAMSECSQIARAIYAAASRVVEGMKYFLRNTRIEEELTNGQISWSTDGVEWKPLPGKTVVSCSSNLINSLDNRTEEILQQYFAEARPTLVGLRHLHRAQNESEPRYKWIDATIAAELAIKEFLILKRPELKSLLIELPSPPLRKLYGSLLKEYGGEESPMKKQLEDGATMRNALVHRPESTRLDRQDTFDYVADVEAAIYHLLYLLYPDDSFFKKEYETMLMQRKVEWEERKQEKRTSNRKTKP